MMMQSPVNPYVHMGNDIKGQDYAEAVQYFTDRFPDTAKLHLMAAHDDQIVGQVEVRALEACACMSTTCYPDWAVHARKWQ